VNYLLGLMGTFEVLDGVLTSWAVKSQHAAEGNVFVSPVSSSWNFLFIKILGGVVSIMAVWMIGKRFPKISVFISSIILLFYAGILAWNAALLL